MYLSSQKYFPKNLKSSSPEDEGNGKWFTYRALKKLAILSLRGQVGGGGARGGWEDDDNDMSKK